MDQAIMIALDLVAIAVMTFGLYFPRHRRRDLVVAYLVVNVGVLAVSAVLGTTAVGVGIGLGLFGVLSIIRLRSSEIAQHEVAYYFAALALGLIAGLTTTVSPLMIALMALLLVTLAIGDSPALFRRYRQQTVVLDTAYTDETALRAALERMLGARVHRVTVHHLDLINDSTTVEVRYQIGDRAATAHEVEQVQR
ncbi:DUF4956 domain-containing protein [Antiquaquibacter soli]|uniref:DUF4956 domain-containing protein n=1 Tax=Antiquaquibacter soli TaxID=3064523 RepID=A0ABT9BN11_9MICO|nr:DUF4956 domain-containing protein [Protaetiibacter sp. WY-16]MDO7882418.1 DUF4956 domain-containing protein [Protaetiibacter sp. WY-16]